MKSNHRQKSSFAPVAAQHPLPPYSGEPHAHSQRSVRASRLLLESARRTYCYRLEDDSVQQQQMAAVIDEAAERYYWLCAAGRRSLSRRFTRDEFLCLVNVDCTRTWERYEGGNMLTALVQTHSAPPESLLEKLCRLSAVENEALLDLCETVWRNRGDLDGTLIDMGVELAPAS